MQSCIHTALASWLKDRKSLPHKYRGRLPEQNILTLLPGHAHTPLRRWHMTVNTDDTSHHVQLPSVVRCKGLL